MGKAGIGPDIDPDPAGKAGRAQQGGRDMALFFKMAVGKKGFHAGELEQDPCPVL
jgi:hypothetical protein